MKKNWLQVWCYMILAAPPPPSVLKFSYFSSTSNTVVSMEFFHRVKHAWQLHSCSSDLISASAKLSELSQSEDAEQENIMREKEWNAVWVHTSDNNQSLKLHLRFSTMKDKAVWSYMFCSDLQLSGTRTQTGSFISGIRFITSIHSLSILKFIKFGCFCV